MRKGRLTEKMMRRFPIITAFVKKKGRLPTNFEIGKLFKVSLNGVGETTKEILDKYKRSITHCTLCGHKWIK